MAADLEWCWTTSANERTAPPGQSQLPRLRRPPAVLSAEAVGDFSRAVEYVDDWENGKGIELFGYDPGQSSLVVDEYELKLRVAIDHFAAYQGGPLRVVIITLEDQENSLVFVPQEPVPFVTRLLGAWDAAWARANARRNYRALGVATLENLYSLPSVHE
ncbi:MAG: hypothetical protein ABR915_19550 [Thermoguttaceae bacterium]